LGKAKKMLLERHGFYPPEEVLKAVRKKVDEVMKRNESIDYITFVADGEPTLDSNLGSEVDLLKNLGIKIGVITNASLIWQEDVRQELMKADLVSIKMDTLAGEIWKKVNRPHGKLRLKKILVGVQDFAKIYKRE
jgi:wyosine [tRNA(Phe)-imidazoG37] synthetase (radical SAM superfamily)